MKNISCRYTLIICIILFLTNCKKGEEQKSIIFTDIKLEDIKPGELKKIDDYPLYYMDYNQDYGFDKHLKSGISKNTIPVENFSGEKNNWACSCFAAMGAKDNILFGRNFDFFHRASLLLHTSPPNGFSSYSMVDLFYCGFSENVSYQELINNPGKLAKAPYLPLDGVNEMGVSIGLMAVPSAKPPYDKDKATFYDLALIRLVLDYAENTDHAITLLQNYNYEATDPPVHFLIADKQGNAAIIEYVDNDMKITRNTEPFMVSTNFIVYNSGAPLDVPCDRYKKAYLKLSQHDGVFSKNESIALLKSISQDITMWSLVYNLNSFNSISITVGRNYTNGYNFDK